MGTRLGLAIAAGLLAAVGLLGSGILLANRVPASGDARLEALAVAVTTAGSTLAAVAVALAGVALTLGMQERAARRAAAAGAQAALVKHALEWVEHQQRRFLDIHTWLDAAVNAVAAQAREDFEERATRAARDRPPHPSIGRLRKLIRDHAVVDALAKADGAVRNWNEEVHGDHIRGEIHVTIASKDAA